MFRRRIVQPITALSKAADKISRGTFVKKVPRSHTLETTNLAKQLVNVMRFMRREKRTKSELEKAKYHRDLLKTIRESDREKESFIVDTYNALNTPLSLIISGAEILRNRQFGDDINAYSEYFDMIYNSGKQLQSYTTDILNPKRVNIDEVIRRSITIQQKKANETYLNLVYREAKKLPEIWADRLRLRQIMVSLLSQSMFCIQDGGTIEIFTRVKKVKKGQKSLLEITIQDDGLGISEANRTEQWENAFGNTYDAFSRNPDVTRLSFSAIEHLIKLHQGTLEINTIYRESTTFVVTLPYLEKEELLTHRTLSDPNIPANNNIIKFPKAE